MTSIQEESPNSEKKLTFRENQVLKLLPKNKVGNTDSIYLWPSGVHPARTRYSYQGKYSCKSKFRSKILEVTSPMTLEVLTLINFNADLALVSPVFGKRCVSVVPEKLVN